MSSPSFMTTTFVIEAMAAANAQLRWKRREQEEVSDHQLYWELYPEHCALILSQVILYVNYTGHGNSAQLTAGNQVINSMKLWMRLTYQWRKRCHTKIELLCVEADLEWGQCSVWFHSYKQNIDIGLLQMLAYKSAKANYLYLYFKHIFFAKTTS